MLVPFLLNVQRGTICSWVKKGERRIQISIQKTAANVYWAPAQCQVQEEAFILLISSIYALSLILPNAYRPAVNLRSRKSNFWIHQSLLLVLRDSKFKLQPFEWDTAPLFLYFSYCTTVKAFWKACKWAKHNKVLSKTSVLCRVQGFFWGQNLLSLRWENLRDEDQNLVSKESTVRFFSLKNDFHLDKHMSALVFSVFAGGSVPLPPTTTWSFPVYPSVLTPADHTELSLFAQESSSRWLSYWKPQRSSSFFT